MIRLIFTILIFAPNYHAKSWLIGKDPDAGRDWGQEEKGTTEDEMAGWHHRLKGCEFEWTPGGGDGQGGLACCNSWGRKESDMTERLNWTESDSGSLIHLFFFHSPLNLGTWQSLVCNPVYSLSFQFLWVFIYPTTSVFLLMTPQSTLLFILTPDLSFHLPPESYVRNGLIKPCYQVANHHLSSYFFPYFTFLELVD